ncbi:MAG: hypothetical protein JWM53_6428 [bacterium]|nr:hypothetical protein [bacterium]
MAQLKLKLPAIRFDAGSVGGQVRVGVWDRWTSWGEKTKDDGVTVFDEATLTQAIGNFKRQSNDLYMDYDHQTAYMPENGKPAVALAWYCALAGVRNGTVFAFATHNESVTPPDAAALEDGLYAYRYEVTDAGRQLLSGGKYKYISPMFDPNGLDEQGKEIGYLFHCCAATNNPFQDGVAITFKKAGSHAMSDEDLCARLGLDADAPFDMVKAAFAGHLTAVEMLKARKARRKLDDDASQYDDANQYDDETEMTDRVKGTAMTKYMCMLDGKTRTLLARGDGVSVYARALRKHDPNLSVEKSLLMAEKVRSYALSGDWPKAQGSGTSAAPQSEKLRAQLEQGAEPFDLTEANGNGATKPSTSGWQPTYTKRDIVLAIGLRLWGWKNEYSVGLVADNIAGPDPRANLKKKVPDIAATDEEGLPPRLRSMRYTILRNLVQDPDGAWLDARVDIHPIEK